MIYFQDKQKVHHTIIIVSLAGFINNHDFLHDMTGNRHFLCFATEYIDYRFDIDIRQMHAQTIALEQKGFQYWFDKDEIAVFGG